MANLLELECPGCTEKLELDPGFAGGVCRCSMCGTLMTVPDDPAAQRAERLVRPSSPGGGRPAAPTIQRDHAPTPGAEPHDEDMLDAIALPEDEQPGDDADGQTYVTESGRVVHIEHHTDIPTAKKKRVLIRATTAIIFASIVAALLALMIFALVMITSPPPPVDSSHLALQRFEYNRDNNPWTMDAPNVLGYPLGERAVIVVDASQESQRWLEDVKHGLAVGLTRADSKARVAVVYATAGGVETMSGGLQSIGGLSESKLMGFQEDIKAGGSPVLRAAIEEAVELKPAVIILVTGRRASAIDLDRITPILDGATTPDDKKLIVDVLNIDRDDPGMERLAQSYGGRYQYYAPRTLSDWRSAAK